MKNIVIKTVLLIFPIMFLYFGINFNRNTYGFDPEYAYLMNGMLIIFTFKLLNDKYIIINKLSIISMTVYKDSITCFATNTHDLNNTDSSYVIWCNETIDRLKKLHLRFQIPPEISLWHKVYVRHNTDKIGYPQDFLITRLQQLKKSDALPDPNYLHYKIS